jgi:hypothetical protein
MLKDANGNCVQDVQGIKNLALNFHQKLIVSSSHVFSSAKARRVVGLIKRKFFENCIAGMNAPVTRVEITKVMFAMIKHKALGLDGFSAGFFHKAWPIVGEMCVMLPLRSLTLACFLRRLIQLFLRWSPRRRAPLLWEITVSFPTVMLCISVSRKSLLIE